MPPSFPKPTRTVDESYLAYVRLLPCLVCGKKPSDPDHLIALGTYQHKRNDLSAVPLCRTHHGERQSRGMKWLNEKYSLDLWQVAWRMATGWLAEKLIDENSQHGKGDTPKR